MIHVVACVVNIGSTSKRYSFLDDQGNQIIFAHLVRAKQCTALFVVSDGKKIISYDQSDISIQDFDDGLSFCLAYISQKKVQVDITRVADVGLRVVAPGTFFAQHKIIDDDYKKQLKKIQQSAPHHITPLFDEIRHIKKEFPRARMIAISDSAFHATMPTKARLYALEFHDTQLFDIYRFGYHGISVQSVLRKLVENDFLFSRIIVCHLGGGVSITAVRNGESVDTSMGFSPTEGIPMETRVGAIDPEALIYLGKQKKYSYEQLSEYLASRCGLFGVCGTTGSMRELLILEERGDQGAAQAIELFVYSIQKYIGAYTVALGGLDAVVFTGAIGEQAPVIRSRICSAFEPLGMSVNDSKNNALSGQMGFFHAKDSSICAAIVPTEEMREIAYQMTAFIHKEK
jgi:acetate kinase